MMGGSSRQQQQAEQVVQVLHTFLAEMSRVMLAAENMRNDLQAYSNLLRDNLDLPSKLFQSEHSSLLTSRKLADHNTRTEAKVAPQQSIFFAHQSSSNMSTKMKNSSPSKADLQVHVEDELDSIHQTLAANDDLQELVEGGGSTDGGGVGVASGAAGASSNPGNLGNREKSLPRGGSRGGADAASAMPDDAEVAAIAASMLPADGREVIE